VVPEQPGLTYDFLPEMVKLGHKEGIKVMGYLCIGSNTRWGMENPDYSYGYPADRHIPYTKKYLGYLDGIIRDAVKKSGIDGFMIDWFYQPNRSSDDGNWLDSEKERYQESMIYLKKIIMHTAGLLLKSAGGSFTKQLKNLTLIVFYG
jgi:hypothetical protein